MGDDDASVVLARMNSEQPGVRKLQYMYISSSKKTKMDFQWNTTLLVKEKPHVHVAKNSDRGRSCLR